MKKTTNKRRTRKTKNPLGLKAKLVFTKGPLPLKENEMMPEAVPLYRVYHNGQLVFLDVDEEQVLEISAKETLDRILHGDIMHEGISVAKAVEILTQALKQDKDFYNSYQANIAMAFQDEFYREMGTIQDGRMQERVHKASNRAARNFLDLWIGDDTGRLAKKSWVDKALDTMKEKLPPIKDNIQFSMAGVERSPEELIEDFWGHIMDRENIFPTLIDLFNNKLLSALEKTTAQTIDASAQARDRFQTACKIIESIRPLHINEIERKNR